MNILIETTLQWHSKGGNGGEPPRAARLGAAKLDRHFKFGWINILGKFFGAKEK